MQRIGPILSPQRQACAKHVGAHSASSSPRTRKRKRPQRAQTLRPGTVSAEPGPSRPSANCCWAPEFPPTPDGSLAAQRLAQQQPRLQAGRSISRATPLFFSLLSTRTYLHTVILLVSRSASPLRFCCFCCFLTSIPLPPPPSSAFSPAAGETPNESSCPFAGAELVRSVFWIVPAVTRSFRAALRPSVPSWTSPNGLPCPAAAASASISSSTSVFLFCFFLLPHASALRIGPYATPIHSRHLRIPSCCFPAPSPFPNPVGNFTPERTSPPPRLSCPNYAGRAILRCSSAFLYPTSSLAYPAASTYLLAHHV